jgi:3-isopropylmalate/(R)-2-methylmalate dehydratase large subunit
MGKTMAEKILARASGVRETSAGDLVIAKLARLMSHESFRHVTKVLRDAGIDRVWDPSRIILVLDHAVPAPDEASAAAHALIRAEAERLKIETFYDVRGGICHQVMVEKGHVAPGELICGTDSHSTMYGALGAAGTGIGVTEAAWVCATGELWFTVPETIRYVLKGKLRPGVSSKDIMLSVAGKFTVEAAQYRSMEWHGEGASALSVESRMVMSNMAIEVGAKFGFFAPDEKTFEYLDAHGVPRGSYEALLPDPDATYVETHEIDLDALVPQVALPHSPDNVVPLSEVKGRKIHQAILGSCTNARIEDLRVAAKYLRGKQVAKHVRMYVSPASVDVYRQAMREGLLEDFLAAGALVLNPGCGACFGKHLGLLAANEVCVSSTNRNFQGRMGSPQAEVILASPLTVAASAVAGVLAEGDES